MQKKRPSSPRRPDARQRLLAAAVRVFTRDGLNGATTRAIAREAAVNEVTLFRLFRSKERLLAAVVGDTFGQGNPLALAALPAFTGNLRADLVIYARHYERVLVKNFPLVRTFVGEIQRHHGFEQQVLKGIFRPLRAGLIQRLDDAKTRGELRRGIDTTILADLFTGMLFTGVLRRTSHVTKPEYPASHYCRDAVELIIRGAAA
ncbi:MAG TPA: TetR/AcrR family transcriptional regulator [Opitutaceae bacterium]|nr:TetR/AcrR family transcriptional regulator [Opitutaceae bacterium]